jgi:hypothetical protein
VKELQKDLPNVGFAHRPKIVVNNMLYELLRKRRRSSADRP